MRVSRYIERLRTMTVVRPFTHVVTAAAPGTKGRRLVLSEAVNISYNFVKTNSESFRQQNVNELNEVQILQFIHAKPVAWALLL